MLPKAIAPIWDLAGESKQVIDYVHRGANFCAFMICGDSKIEVRQLNSLFGDVLALNINNN
ncbi:diguanylate cyclase [Nostoc sp. PCC 7107]|nr:diguanylate cyclase [Nostoc sp. PCC 7107]